MTQAGHQKQGQEGTAVYMPKKGRAAGGATPRASKRDSSGSGRSSPVVAAIPAVEADYEALEEDLEAAGEEAIQAVQSSNASIQVKARVTALGSKFLAQRDQIAELRAAETELRAELAAARRAESPTRGGYETAAEDSGLLIVRL